MLKPYARALLTDTKKDGTGGLSKRGNRPLDAAKVLPTDVEEELHSLVDTIEQGYEQVIYHNFMHAVDVTHMMYVFVDQFFDHNMNGGHKIGEREKFYLLLACLCHDLGHFGYGNGVLYRNLKACSFSKDYNRCINGDQCKPSVMEFCHLEKAIEVVETHQFFKNDKVAPHVVSTLKVWLVDLILATDIANQQFFLDIVDKNKASDLIPVRSDLKGIEKPPPMMLLFIKLADVSNVFRSFECAKRWTLYIMTEAEVATQVAKESEKEGMGEDQHSLLKAWQETKVEFDKSAKTVEQRMQGFAERFVVPMLLSLKNVNLPLYNYLCKGLETSLNASNFTTTDFLKEICDEL